MGIPGVNLLNIASRVISLRPVPYYRFLARVLNANRQYTTGYEAPTDVAMSVQRVPRSLYKDMGLDFQKVYVTLYASVNVIDLQRDSSGDKIEWAGRWYKIESAGTWYEQDGWARALAVDIGIAT